MNIVQHILRNWYRLFQPASTFQALRQLHSPTLVTRIASQVPSAYLLEQFAAEQALNSSELLKHVAKRLSLPATHELEPVTAELIARSGHSAELLRSVLAIPQRSPIVRDGIQLVVADPAILDVKRYQQIGVYVSLGLASEIDKAWVKYFDSFKATIAQLRENTSRPRVNGFKELSVEEARVAKSLERLASEALSRGSKELLLGVPNPTTYEFDVNGRRFSGRMSDAFLPNVRRLMSGTGEIQLRSSIPGVSALILTQLRGAGLGVVLITWNKTDQVLEESNSHQTASTILTTDSSLPTNSTTFTYVSPGQVLIIDDDSCFQTIISRVLEKRGWRIVKQTNSVNALEALCSGILQPDLIVCDVHMPQLDGISLLKSLRQQNILAPVLMLTSDDDPRIEIELALCGADGFVRKQEDPKILVAWCDNLLTKSRQVLGNVVAGV